MMVSVAALDGLKRKRPEWEPWLGVVEEVVREASTTRWDRFVPYIPSAGQTRAPLLAGATISLSASAVRRVLQRLMRIASRSGSPKMATLTRASDPDRHALTLFTASLCHRSDRVADTAAGAGVDADALQAVVALLPVPFLQACHRAWSSSVSRSWVEGYCPVCGAWPAFAEVRGIERSRHYRCGRCGGEWHAHALHCPYCAMRDHAELITLVPEHGSTHAVIDACKACLGYVKTFTRLQGCSRDTVMLEDLASVTLDVAALERGFRRPEGTGYPLDVSVIEQDGARRFFSWKA
jgi:FdhE protein